MSADLVAKIMRSARRAELISLRDEFADYGREAERRRMARRARVYAELVEILQLRIRELAAPCSHDSAVGHQPAAFAGAVYCARCGDRLADSAKVCDCPPDRRSLVTSVAGALTGWWRCKGCGGLVPPTGRTVHA